MYKKNIVKLFCLLIPILLVGQDSKKKTDYTLATATKGGTYYPVGVAIAKLINLKLKKQDIHLSEMVTHGSDHNVKLLLNGEVDFAIVNGLFGSMAWENKDKFEGKKEPRAITLLWNNYEQFVIDKQYAKTGSVMDLKKLYGKKFVIGKKKSGSRISGEALLKTLGIELSKMDIQYMGYNDAAKQFSTGEVQGANMPSGVPTNAVKEAFSLSKNPLTILNFTPEDQRIITEEYGPNLWIPLVIKAGTYPNQKEDIHTIGQGNLLITQLDIPEEVVYQLTKTIYENLDFLKNEHKATREMALQKAIDGLPLPLHPGAARFYKEKGVEIPSWFFPEAYTSK